MGWFCNTPEAKAQMKICEKNKCQGCNKCIWIEESANAMSEYGTEITQEVEVEEIKEEKEFFDTSPREFNSFEEKVTYINKLFKGE